MNHLFCAIANSANWQAILSRLMPTTCLWCWSKFHGLNGTLFSFVFVPPLLTGKLCLLSLMLFRSIGQIIVSLTAVFICITCIWCQSGRCSSGGSGSKGKCTASFDSFCWGTIQQHYRIQTPYYQLDVCCHYSISSKGTSPCLLLATLLCQLCLLLIIQIAIAPLGKTTPPPLAFLASTSLTLLFRTSFTKSLSRDLQITLYLLEVWYFFGSLY